LTSLLLSCKDSFSSDKIPFHPYTLHAALNVARPYAAVTPTVEGDVLVTLARTRRPLTGREVAKLVRRGTQPSVQRALNHLVNHGLVDSQEAGPAVLYTLNREHLAYPAVEVLATMRNELVERLRKTIVAWKIKPVHASIFGSTARADGDTTSDIDLFVVRPGEVSEEDATWRGQLDDLAASIKRWTGNRSSISEIAQPELARLNRERPPVVPELEQDSIGLAGPTATELIRAATER
jgi:predicted nucleotidyltransferase